MPTEVHTRHDERWQGEDRQFLIDCHRFLATYNRMRAEALDRTDGDIDRAQQLILERIQATPDLLDEITALAERAKRLPDSPYTRVFSEVENATQNDH